MLCLIVYFRVSLLRCVSYFLMSRCSSVGAIIINVSTGLHVTYTCYSLIVADDDAFIVGNGTLLPSSNRKLETCGHPAA